MNLVKNAWNSTELKKLFNKQTKTTLFIMLIIKAILVYIAFSLSWECSSRDSAYMRLFTTAIAAVLSPFYIVYYLIYRIIMGNKCY